MRRTGGIIMIKATTTAFTTELHRVTQTMDGFFAFLTVNDVASSISNKSGPPLLPSVFILG
jgi:hypothetical protein